ncbi:hypothetical protein DLE60_18015 [Micromonospora globispora]|uniref:hypothetical protein n=1 Tax=Micromonospora globispora TaxID=1450148 RepID=UPI000D6F7E39|nr:hypothetical protein [Micromonospora globispora]PWU59142.1 hypothetical protein DLE60_18015 [Micromonospora globispora]
MDADDSRYRTNGRTQARTVERIVAMLRDVPSVGRTDSEVANAPRWAMIALAVAAGLVSVAAFIAKPILLPAVGR